MGEYKNGNNTLKEVLARRKTAELPEDFTAKMMENIRFKLERKRKIQTIAVWGSLIVTSLAFIIGVYYTIHSYLKINLLDYLPRLELSTANKEILGFSWYISLIVALLLGLDYWFRTKKRKSTQE